MPIPGGLPLANGPARSLEEYRGRNDPEAVKAVAQEMEAMFAYELLKAMRKSSGTSMKGGLGGDTYSSLFDMELSKVIAKRGLGLQDMVLKGIRQKNEAASTEKQEGTTPPDTPQKVK